MFDFYGRIGAPTYIKLAGITLAAYAILISAPWLLAMTTGMGECRGGTGDCVAGAMIMAFFYMPVVAAVPVLALLAGSVARARDAGLPAWLGLAVPVLLGINFSTLMMPFNGFMMAQSVGRSWTFGLTYMLQPTLVAALVSIVALSLLPTATQGTSLVGRFGRVGIAFAASAVAVLLLAIQSIAWILRVPAPLRFDSNLQYVVVAAFSICAAFCVVRARGSTPEPGAASAPAGAPPLRLHFLWLAFASVVMAVLLVSFFGPGRPLGVALFAGGMIVLPTAAIYLPLLVTATLLSKRRYGPATLAGLIAMVPFVWWGYDYLRANEHLSAAELEVAALPQVSIDSYPPVMVIMGRNELPPGIRSIPGVERAIVGEATRWESIDVKQRPIKREPVAALPDNYLLLRMGVKTSLAARGTRYRYQTPYELSVVRNGAEQPIRSTYAVAIAPPWFPPMLTPWGWERQRPSMRSDDMDEYVAEFFAEALAGAVPETSSTN